jgi:hypothetical protein
MSMMLSVEKRNQSGSRFLRRQRSFFIQSSRYNPEIPPIQALFEQCLRSNGTLEFRYASVPYISVSRNTWLNSLDLY